MKQLEQFYIDSESKSDKGAGHTYIQKYYSDEFSPHKNKPLNILEIGYWKGDSLKLWHDFFPNAVIHVVENNNSKGGLPQGISERSIIYNQDAYNKAFVDSLPDNFFDYVIDDGPHTLISQKQVTGLYLPKIKSGGKLIIEDIQNEYKDIAEIIASCPKKVIDVIKVFDLRHIIGRYDDIIIEITKI
jgi:hypothetical protein